MTCDKPRAFVSVASKCWVSACNFLRRNLAMFGIEKSLIFNDEEMPVAQTAGSIAETPCGCFDDL